MTHKSQIFLTLLILPAISFAQNFQNHIAYSSSYGHISENTNTYVWEPDSIVNIGIVLDFNQLSFQIFGNKTEQFNLVDSKIIKDNHFNTRTYRCSAIDLDGNNVMIIYSQLKNTSELTIVQKNQSAVKYNMTNLLAY